MTRTHLATTERSERDAVIAARNAETDSVWHRANDLNREMMRLPMDERRERWKEYYARLCELTKR
jgi:hypothetical protein